MGGNWGQSRRGRKRLRTNPVWIRTRRCRPVRHGPPAQTLSASHCTQPIRLHRLSESEEAARPLLKDKRLHIYSPCLYNYYNIHCFGWPRPGLCVVCIHTRVCVFALCCITACDSSEGMCADRPYIILSGSLGADRD